MEINRRYRQKKPNLAMHDKCSQIVLLIFLLILIPFSRTYASDYDQPAYTPDDTEIRNYVLNAATSGWVNLGTDNRVTTTDNSPIAGVFTSRTSTINISVRGLINACGGQKQTSSSSSPSLNIAQSLPFTLLSNGTGGPNIAGTITSVSSVNNLFNTTSGPFAYTGIIGANKTVNGSAALVALFQPGCLTANGQVSSNGYGRINIQIIPFDGSSAITLPIDSNGNFTGSDPITGTAIAMKAGTIEMQVTVAPGATPIGKYYVHIAKTTTNSTISSIIDWVTTPIKASLDRVTNLMYTGITSDAGYKRIVYLSLTLYMILYAIFFILALVPMTQIELVIRITKITFIMILLSDQSWEFFNTYIYSVFTLGRDYLITAVTGHSPTGASIFSFFDRSIGRFFMESTWIKMGALINTPIMGWVVFAMIISSLWHFLMAAIEAVIGYLVSYIALSLLIALAPIFFIFLLFTHTKKMFEAWLSHLFNFAIQPIILFAAMALMNEIMICMFYKALSFPTSAACIWPAPDWLAWIWPCFIRGPVPDDFNPLVRLTYGIVLIIITDLLAQFMEFAPQIAGALTGESILEDIATTRSAGGGHYILGQAALGLIGQDQGSKDRRKDAKQAANAAAGKPAGTKPRATPSAAPPPSGNTGGDSAD